MSDDGFADDVFSSYSDFDDILYDADPSPDLADDLASHAIHSPVYADDPGYGLLEYHSDWDYYSDDYYDDDPALLKKNPQDGGLPKTQKQAKRGKKRKLADVDDIPEIDLGERAKLRDCIKGTVWAKPAVQRSNIYKSGQEPKIALLRDWQKRFGISRVNQSVKSKRPRSEEDESWANDMSLADMGLLTERRSRVEQPAATQATEEDQQDADYEPEDVYIESEPENALPEATLGMEATDVHEIEDDSEVLKVHAPKRSRRLNAILPSPPTSTESTTVDGDQILNVPKASPEVTLTASGRGRPNRTQLSEVVDASQTQAANGVDSTEARRGPRNKKRRASASPSPETEMQGAGARVILPMASVRGKRLASSANSVKSDLKSRPTTDIIAKARSTRNKTG